VVVLDYRLYLHIEVLEHYIAVVAVVVHYNFVAVLDFVHRLAVAHLVRII